jgi:acyl-CoA thioesterase-1
MPLTRLQLLFLSIFIIAIGSWVVLRTPSPLLPTAGTTVVVFGDSLAAGVGATTGSDIASRLAAILQTPVINLGVSGDTTLDGLKRVEALKATNPRIVIVFLGGNDALQRLPIENTFANLALLIEHIQSTGAAVILVGEPGGLYGAQYEAHYERLAKTYRTFYVSNILSGLLGRPEYMSDYIHPNDAGYEKVTERILPVVQTILSAKQSN